MVPNNRRCVALLALAAAAGAMPALAASPTPRFASAPAATQGHEAWRDELTRADDVALRRLLDQSWERRFDSTLVLDHVLSEGELGLDFLPEFKELLPFVPIIVVSGALEVHQQMQALQGPRRAHYCLTKPVDKKQLLEVVAAALK